MANIEQEGEMQPTATTLWSARPCAESLASAELSNPWCVQRAFGTRQEADDGALAWSDVGEILDGPSAARAEAQDLANVMGGEVY